MKADRVLWPDLLRGPAALAVMLSHLTEGTGVLSPSVQILFGQAGVAVFFVVSGFVVPFAFRRQSGAEFLIGRVVRLWPVFAVSIALGCWCLVVRAERFGEPFPLTAAELAGNLLLGLRDLLGLGEVDAVVWTLEAETRSYAVAALFAGSFSLSDAGLIWRLMRGLICLTAVAGWWCYFDVPGSRVAGEVGVDCQVWALMLVGVVLHFRHVKAISRRRCGLLLSVAIAIVVTTASVSKLGPVSYVMLTAASVGLAVVALAYVCRRWVRSAPLLGGLSAVSYSLYLTHRPIGCLVVDELLRLDVPAAVALAIASCVCLVVAVGVWYVVERPSRRVASLLGREWNEAIRGRLVTSGDRDL